MVQVEKERRVSDPGTPEDVVLLDKNKVATMLPAVPAAPADRNNYVYLIFLLHGVGVLMAWNMFITAKSYFVDYKLSLNMTTTTGSNSSSPGDQDWQADVKEYRSNFLSYLGIAAQIPNVVCNALNLFIRTRLVLRTGRGTLMSFSRLTRAT